MSSWVLTLFVALNILMLLIAAVTYVYRAAQQTSRSAE